MADRCLTWKILRLGVTYVVLAVDGWYEQIDERLKSRAVSTHFGLKFLRLGQSFFDLHR